MAHSPSKNAISGIKDITKEIEAEMYGGWFLLMASLQPKEGKINEFTLKAPSVNHGVLKKQKVGSIIQNFLGNPLGLTELPGAVMDNDNPHIIIYNQVRRTDTEIMMVAK
jgi:hypothetical protein